MLDDFDDWYVIFNGGELLKFCCWVIPIADMASTISNWVWILDPLDDPVNIIDMRRNLAIIDTPVIGFVIKMFFSTRIYITNRIYYVESVFIYKRPIFLIS